MDSEKQDFLMNEAFGVALRGTVQRANVYRKGATEIQRRAFQSALRRTLDNFVEQYQKGISEEQHLENINYLARILSEAFSDILTNGRFRIGCAQKALNLYLKCLWCLDHIPTPPHCPFDREVLTRVAGCQKVNWTTLDSLSEYQRIVTCAKQAANGVSLSEWELRLYRDALSAKRTMLPPEMS